MIKFREATLSDFIGAWKVLRMARDMMLKAGRHQWTAEYPCAKNVMEDITSHQAYVLEAEGEIVGYVVAAKNGEPKYNDIQGRWLSEQDYFVLHRLAISPTVRGKGLAKRIFHEVENLCISQAIHSIKIDTNNDNVEMLGMLQRLGFTYCGIINYDKNKQRLAFEKLV